jgi:hypothetical protein
MFLFDFNDLIFMIVFEFVDLLVVDVLQVLPCLLGVNIFTFNFDHVTLEFLKETINGLLVLLFEFCYTCLVMLFHF